MNFHFLQYLNLAFGRVRSNMLLVMTGVTILSFVVLFAGMRFEPKYETSITIYADQSNVITPLLEGQASVTRPRTERARIVKETLYSTRLLEEILPIAFPDADLDDREGSEKQMATMRSQLGVTAPASNYISISYAHVSPKASYQMVNKLANLFIEESARTKRAESKSAFNFIDEQVKTYKSQLVEAENRLKAYEAGNVDGFESQVNASINRLQAVIDEMAINAEAEEVRIEALEIQLANEGRFTSNDYNARVYRDRLAQLESQLGTTELRLRSLHPDVLDLKVQIEDLKKTIIEIEQSTDSGHQKQNRESVINPLYQQLNQKLSESRVNVQTMRTRIAANENRLQQQYKRRVRVAASQAEFSELTRDYSVTKNIYEDMLERKERARISMTLDMTGQGVSYKVLEPAKFPVLPTGTRYLHFVIAGPALGIIVTLAVVLLGIAIDDRIMFAEQLNDMYPGLVMAVFPSGPNDNNWGLATFVVSSYAVAYAGTAITFSYYA